MNDELQQAIAEMIETTTEAATTAGEFLKGEIPDFIYTLLLWKGIESFIWFSVGVISLAVIAKYCSRTIATIRGWIKGGSSYERAFVTVWGVGVALVFYIVVFSSYVNLIWLQIWIAPKVYLVEYVASLAS